MVPAISVEDLIEELKNYPSWARVDFSTEHTQLGNVISISRSSGDVAVVLETV